MVRGKVKVLLGLSSVHDDQASDFGGLRDAIDCYNPGQTAAREGCEELMFIFDHEADFKRLLVLRNTYGKKFDIVQASSSTYGHLYNGMDDGLSTFSDGYIMYFVNIPYQKNLSQLFLQRKALYEGLLPHCWDETVRLVWVDIDELFEAIDIRDLFRPVKIEDFNLYEPFVRSIKVARDQGIIGNLALNFFQ